ncbi:cob(I)yrinic acid a,c-diamide adenosyltransferase [Lactonifactor longoviformis]|uniref:cob(I)yrinic acid a,c-diamide adenosyltransferase n=1 Tax=Lactonifactor longoviformis TaxID=341220 RepID=UPI0036F3CD0D
MEKGLVEVYCGLGMGKTPVAIGQAIRAVGQGKSVILIQFLKGRAMDELNFMERLEPEIKVFRFEKNEKYYQELTEEEKQEEDWNIKNGLNFARKVLVTEECDLLILDEILGVVEHGIITGEELKTLIECKDKHTGLILTGYHMCEEIRDCVDTITTFESIENEKKKQEDDNK